MALQNALEGLAVESKQDTQITQQQSTNAKLDLLNMQVATETTLSEVKDNQTNGTAKNLLVDLDGHIVNVQSVNSQISGDEYGIITNAIIHGKTSQGEWKDVKVNPSGALTVSVGDSALPTGASTSALQTTANTKLDDLQTAIENLQINLSNQGFIRNKPLSYDLIAGTLISGTIESAQEQNGQYLVLQETGPAGGGLTVDFNFTLEADKKVEQIVFKGRYVGSPSHWVDVYAYDYVLGSYVLLTNSTNRFSNTSEDITLTLDVFNTNFTDANDNVKVRLKHNTTTYVSGHQLFIDYVHCAYVSAIEFNLEGVATTANQVITNTKLDSIITNTTKPIYKTIYETVGSVTYIGKAVPGTLTSAGAWQIQKIDETSGTIITWANGGSKDQIWNNRASLTYS